MDLTTEATTCICPLTIRSAVGHYDDCPYGAAHPDEIRGGPWCAEHERRGCTGHDDAREPTPRTA